MKKLLALICVIAMLLSVCACAGEGTTTIVETSDFSDMDVPVNGNNSGDAQSDASGKQGTESIATGSNSIINNPLKGDLKGAKVVIYDTRGAFSGGNGSKAEQAKTKLLDKIQKELNCKLVVNKVDGNKLLSLTSASAAGGTAIGGIITMHLYDAGKFIAQNLVANLTKISSLDLTKDYMNVGDALNATKFGSGKYGACIDSSAATVFYNKRILKEIGYGENYLYDLVDKGQWTYTQVRKLGKAAVKELDGKSGMSADDQWGIVVQDLQSGMLCDIMVSMGTSMVVQQGGQLKLNMSDSKMVKVVELAHNIYSKDGIRYDTQGEEAVKYFAGGKSLFLYSFAEKAYMLTKMKDEFGVLPLPKVDGAKSYKNGFDWNFGVAMIPAGLSAKDQYNAGAVLQARLYLEKNVTEAKKKEYVNRYFCDSKSGDNYIIAVNAATAQPNQCYAHYTEALLAGTYRPCWRAIESGESLTTAVESTKSAASKALEDLNKKIKDK